MARGLEIGSVRQSWNWGYGSTRQSASSELNIQAFRTGASLIAIDEQNAPFGLMESAAPTSELHFFTAIRGGS